MKPTRRTLWLLALAVLPALLPALGVTRAWPLSPVAMALAMLALAADAILMPRGDRVSWNLVAPDSAYVGATERVVVDLRLERDSALPVSLALDLSPELGAVEPVSGKASVAGGRFEWTLRPVRRGVGTVEWLWVRWWSPLGFWMRTSREPVDTPVRVLPNVGRLRAQALRFFADRDFRAGLKVERYRGDGSEFDSLKDYLPGDDHRTMDWKATARHRRPLCRLHRAERDHQVIFAIDSGRLMSEPIRGLSRLDHAIDGALLLAWVCLATGDRVGMFDFGARPGGWLAPEHGVHGMQPLLETASGIAYGTEETNYTLGLTTLGQRLRRRSLIVLLTDFVDTVTAELLLENVGRMVRRHLVVFLSIHDPLLGALASAPPATGAALGRAVVARELLRDREEVHLRLRRAGVHALDVPPERVAPDLIRQYLEIKRREGI